MVREETDGQNAPNDEQKNHPPKKKESGSAYNAGHSGTLDQKMSD
jgi:hypothetical protein